MKRMSPERRRETIIDAAVAVATAKGLGATTVRDVAGRMGTSSGLIHHYFDSMEEVLACAFLQVARRDLEASRTALASEQRPIAKLMQFVTTYFAPASDQAFQFWLDAWSEAGRNSALQQASRALNVEWHEMLLEVIESGTASGDFECADPGGVSWSTLSLLDGLALQVVAHRTILGRPDSIELAARSLEQDLGLLDGVLAGSAMAI